MQTFADETGLVLHIHHYPPGTSKWNKSAGQRAGRSASAGDGASNAPEVEHRLFCRITQNWRGRLLTDRLAVVELIGATTTKTGLKVACALDPRTYEKGIKVSNAEMASLNSTGDDFRPEWNCTFRPRSSKSWRLCCESPKCRVTNKTGPSALLHYLSTANEWRRRRHDVCPCAPQKTPPGKPMKYTKSATTTVLSVATLLVMAAMLSTFPMTYPSVSLETGWGMSMSEAVGEGLAIGRDISFTFGPYTAIYTHEYHPAVGTAMILIPLLFSLSCASGFLCLDIRRNCAGALAVSCGIFLAGYAQEAMFLTIPLLHLLVTDLVTRRSPSSPVSAIGFTHLIDC